MQFLSNSSTAFDNDTAIAPLLLFIALKNALAADVNHTSPVLLPQFIDSFFYSGNRMADCLSIYLLYFCDF